MSSEKYILSSKKDETVYELLIIFTKTFYSNTINYKSNKIKIYF